MNKIICAAIKVNDVILMGVRHWDKLMNDQAERYGLFDIPHEDQVQGFIDLYGNFVNRSEALKIAEEANQIIRKTKPDWWLYSEDIY